jgi:hypothetical protein
MKNPMTVVTALGGLLLILAAATPMNRYETVEDEETVLVPDADTILVREYLRRARESIEDEKPLTAAAQLRRAATSSGRAADSARGEARRALEAIRSQALKLAYAAETRSDSAERRIGEFSVRTDNLLQGELMALEAKEALARGDRKAARMCLKVAAQQIDRRALRADEYSWDLTDAARDVRRLLDGLETTDLQRAQEQVADLVKTARDLEEKYEKKAKKTPPTFTSTYTYSPYGTESPSPYDTSTQGYPYGRTAGDGYTSPGVSRAPHRPSYDYGDEMHSDTSRSTAPADMYDDEMYGP